MQTQHKSKPDKQRLWASGRGRSRERSSASLALTCPLCLCRRDACCASSSVPLSYFRVTAHGAAQAAIPPPLSLGPAPNDTFGSGHQPHIHAAKGSGSRDITLSAAESRERRMLHTFLLLPDAGVYALRVRLVLFGVSASMVAESFVGPPAWSRRPGMFVNRLLTNEHGDARTIIVVPKQANTGTPLPWCGQDTQAHGNEVDTEERPWLRGLPLAGRWRLQLPDPLADSRSGSSNASSYIDSPLPWLVDHSRWEPYHCRFDPNRSAALLVRALSRVKWLHVIGDSNPRRLFFHLCRAANGSLHASGVPWQHNPPQLCVGPSSPSNEPDSVSRLPVGSAARWVITLTHWFWNKAHDPIPLNASEPQPNSTRFSFADECALYVDRAVVPANDTRVRGAWRGWHHCGVAPSLIQRLHGPGATMLSWGSHAPELGTASPTEQMMRSEQAFGHPYFRQHPTLFPLVTAVNPALIPAKFGTQQRIRNNERVGAVNRIMQSTVHGLETDRLDHATHEAAPRQQEHRQSDAGADDYPSVSAIAVASAPLSPRRWFPVLDLFSPSHACFEGLSAPNDAVHFRSLFDGEVAHWLAHYLVHAPNFA